MLVPGSLAHRAYWKTVGWNSSRVTTVLIRCIERTSAPAGLQVTGLDPTGEVRIVELGAHRFFMATLFLPQVASGPDRPHPLIMAYLQAAQHG